MLFKWMIIILLVLSSQVSSKLLILKKEDTSDFQIFVLKCIRKELCWNIAQSTSFTSPLLPSFSTSETPSSNFLLPLALPYYNVRRKFPWIF